MNTDIHSQLPTNQLQEAAGKIGRSAANAANDVAIAASHTYESLSAKVGAGVDCTKEYAQHAVDAAKGAAHRATDTAKGIYQSAAVKTEDILVTSKDYAREHPFPVAVGTMIGGFVLGYLVGLAKREELTFRQRLFS